MAIPIAAGIVINSAKKAITNAFFLVPLPVEIIFKIFSVERFFRVLAVLVLTPRFSNHSSTESRISGAHIPVKRNAANIPNAASIPNDRNAAMSLKRLAAKADIVVNDVSKIARPTLDSVVVAADSADLPAFLSSL